MGGSSSKKSVFGGRKKKRVSVLTWSELKGPLSSKKQKRSIIIPTLDKLSVENLKREVLTPKKRFSLAGKRKESLSLGNSRKESVSLKSLSMGKRKKELKKGELKIFSLDNIKKESPSPPPPPKTIFSLVNIKKEPPPAPSKNILSLVNIKKEPPPAPPKKKFSLRQTDGRTDRQTGSQTDRQVDIQSQMARESERETDGQGVRERDRWPGSQRERQMARESERETDGQGVRERDRWTDTPHHDSQTAVEMERGGEGGGWRDGGGGGMEGWRGRRRDGWRDEGWRGMEVMGGRAGWRGMERWREMEGMEGDGDGAHAGQRVVVAGNVAATQAAEDPLEARRGDEPPICGSLQRGVEMSPLYVAPCSEAWR
ncbi:unnamed protein product [Coregonus sp. 'balchen']|nr:unnamed protein product [Coregonus sp. 'balchen']